MRTTPWPRSRRVSGSAVRTANAQSRGIGRREFESFRRLIHDVSGISLGENKDALLAARIARRMRDLSIDDHADYLDVVLGDRSGEEVCKLIDAVSTNVTSFFREPVHFEVLAEHLGRLRDARVTDIRLWSAACSTGEEPYSMAMVASRVLDGSGIRVRVLATDIASDVLETARQGRYHADKVDRVPAEYRAELRRAGSAQWEVDPRVKSLVTFARINLSAPPFVMSGPFEVIMCRNVMIYFRAQTRQALVAEAERMLAPGGLLMLGHAESLAGMRSALRAERPAVYRKAPR